jgi:fructose transport system substrate-binding protein
LFPCHPVGAQRHNGFLQGLGLMSQDTKSNNLAQPAEVVCMADSFGNATKSQVGMKNCLEKNPAINLVYTINEPAAAGKGKGVLIVSVDGGCEGVKNVGTGVIAATAQQYPLKMAALGVAAGVEYANTGRKVSGYTDTGVTLVAAKAIPRVYSMDVKTGTALCWGEK